MWNKLRCLARCCERVDKFMPEQLEQRISEELGFQLKGRMHQAYFLLIIKDPKLKSQFQNILESLHLPYEMLNGVDDILSCKVCSNFSYENIRYGTPCPIVFIETQDNQQACIEYVQAFVSIGYCHLTIIFSKEQVTESSFSILNDMRAYIKNGIFALVWSPTMVTKSNIYLLIASLFYELPHKYKRLLGDYTFS